MGGFSLDVNVNWTVANLLSEIKVKTNDVALEQGVHKWDKVETRGDPVK